MSDKDSVLSPQTALIYAMVIASAAEGNMSDRELFTIGEIVRTLPVFVDYDPEHLPRSASNCAEILAQRDGLETILELIKDALNPRFRETAYALACDIVASDGVVTPEEARLLEMVRHRLDIERLIAAAIERGARARYTVDV